MVYYRIKLDQKFVNFPYFYQVLVALIVDALLNNLNQVFVLIEIRYHK